MKNKKFIVIFALIMVIAFGGTVMAFMVHKSVNKTNTFIPAAVSCEVEETFADNSKSSITVKNTGNIDAFIRVRLVTYWVNSEGNTVGKPGEMPHFTIADGWIKGENNTYYCTAKVAAETSTPTLLGSSINLETSSEGYRQVVEVFAEAVQAEPYEQSGGKYISSAAKDAWGVELEKPAT